jgi:hypothetical protein
MPYKDHVFINCPFDDDFKPLFHALIFAILDCGFVPRCSREIDDGSQVRVAKIKGIIEQCRLGIHDISRTELDKGLPRFNMPFELGLFLGAKEFGASKQRQKACLIMDIEPYRYQRYISDIAGQDIQAHGGKAEKLIEIVRNWLGHFSTEMLPGADKIRRKYRTFRRKLPGICKQAAIKLAELTYIDYCTIISRVLKSSS